MKKKKREKLKAKREAKRKELKKKRMEYIKKATNHEEADLMTMDPDLTMMMHFPSGEFGCNHCVDYIAKVCSGNGLTSFEECMDCIVQHAASNLTIMEYEGFDC